MKKSRPLLDELIRKRRQSVVVTTRPAIFDLNILLFGETHLVETPTECLSKRRKFDSRLESQSPALLAAAPAPPPATPPRRLEPL
jgi:hypothetical protein